MSFKLLNFSLLNTGYTTHAYFNHYNCKPLSWCVRTLAFELEQAWIRENKLLTEHSSLLPTSDNYQHMHTKVPGSIHSACLCVINRLCLQDLLWSMFRTLWSMFRTNHHFFFRFLKYQQVVCMLFNIKLLFWKHNTTGRILV